MSDSYQKFAQFAEDFISEYPGKPVPGDYYGLQGKTVYHTSSMPLPGKGRLEINRTTSDAGPSFSWHTEITLNDKESGEFIHVILKDGDELEETYGKTVLEVSDTRANKILELLRRLKSHAT